MATNRLQKMQSAVKLLGGYYGLAGVGEFGKFAAFLEPIGVGPGGIARQASESANTLGTPREIDNKITAKLVETVIDTADGCLSTPDLCTDLSKMLSNGDIDDDGRVDGDLATARTQFQEAFYIAYDSEDAGRLNAGRKKSDGNDDTLRQSGRPIREMLGTVGESINKNLSSPNKQSPALSILMSNTKRIALTQRHANACCLFLNGIPNIEIAKAIPYLDIEFHFPGAPFTSDGKLQSPGLLKFLVGAQQRSRANQSSAFEIMADANKTRVNSTYLENGETVSGVEDYSIGGMEMFTAPQTLVNANEQDQESIRGNPVLDKFKPLATLKQFEVNVVGSTGINSFKSAKLEFTLHDRSRLSEIADFIRPDLYSHTEMVIEYGWSHPDGENNTGNVYGDLINGMCLKETFGISNASYTMDDAGQINVTLSLFTKGGTDLSTELISTTQQGGITNTIRHIRELEELIGEIRQRVWPSDGRTREVRGVQSLDVAQDALSNLLLSPQARREMATLRTQIARAPRGGAPSRDQMSALADALEKLLGSGTDNNAQGAGGAVAELRSTVMKEIQEKIKAMTSGTDPFLRSDYGVELNEGYGIAAGANRRRMNREAEQMQAQIQQVRAGLDKEDISLANILLHFIGVPLACSGKFEDVQLIFYPFNTYAGYASKINIAEFVVDSFSFAEELYRYRLDNLARSSAMSLRDFITFLGQTIIDDPAAKPYGLRKLWQAPTYDASGRPQDPVMVAPDVPTHQREVEERLRTVTPSGEFRMPKIDFFMECLPQKQPRVETQNVVSGKNVLRIHIFDSQSSTYDTVGALYAASRTNLIQSVGVMPTSETEIAKLNNRDAQAYLTQAEQSGLLERISRENEPATYRIAGGARKIKEFVMGTMPYIIYGAAGSLVKIANLSSIQDASLATVNMLRSFRKSELDPNGRMPGGLPMRIIPASLQMETIGCPLLSFAQQFFVDFQTGTTADNIYAVVGLSHRITQGEFTSTFQMVAPNDAYGVYENFGCQIQLAARFLRAGAEHVDTNNNQGNPQT